MGEVSAAAEEAEAKWTQICSSWDLRSSCEETSAVCILHQSLLVARAAGKSSGSSSQERTDKQLLALPLSKSRHRV